MTFLSPAVVGTAIRYGSLARHPALGTGLSRSIGLRTGLSRLTLAVFAALMTAISSFLVRPLSMAGLVAPHLARLMGFQRPHHQLASAMLIGACMLVLADWLSRVVI